MNFVTQILTIRSELKKGLAIFLGNFFILSVFAQTDFPNKAVKLIVPGVSGSTSDIVARVIAKQLIEQTTKTFIVENRPGASAIIGNEIVAHAQPDGYVLLLADSSFTTVPGMRKNLPYDPLRDFLPITQLLASPIIFCVRSNLGVQTLPELIRMARASPGKLNYGSGGVGVANHIYVEIFKKAAQVDINHIPFSGGVGDALKSLLGSHIDLMVSTIPTVLSQVNAGRLRALAVSTEHGHRLPSLPLVPSVGELGLDNIAVSILYGVIGPSGLPQEVVDKLYFEMIKAVKTPSLEDRFLSLGAIVVGSSPVEFSRTIRREINRWSEVTREAGITLEN
jgi:tripartite-type tricarboxylate transporter receptor subunit TctC